MNCPICNGTTSVASTVKNGEDFVKRKRKCMQCGRLFITLEKFDTWTQDKKFDFEKANYEAQRALEFLGKDDREIGIIKPVEDSDDGKF